MDLSINRNDNIKEYITNILKIHISNSESYYWYSVKPHIKKSYKIYHADEDYYNEKFPQLSKSSNLVSTDVADTIEWALPSLMRIFFGSQEILQLSGVNPEDEDNAKLMQQLVVWQLQRKNNAFMVFYNWFKEALITGVGIIKCYWEREVRQQEVEEIMALPIIQEMEAQGVQITYGEMVDEAQLLYKVRYIQEIPVKNHPKIENVLASELRYSPEARSIEEAQFVAHKKRVTLNHMLKMQDMGYYSNVDNIDQKEMQRAWLVDDLEIEVTGLEKLTLQGIHGVSISKANQYYDLYECYIDIDMEQNNRLKKMIITICGNTILRIEENIYGRPPFFLVSPMKDPYRIWPKRSYSDLIGQLQDLKVGLTRQLMKAIALSNEPRMVVDETAVNIHDYIQNRAIIRKKPGLPMAEAIHPIPTQPLHPWTFQFLEYIEGQKENRTGITRYNQGLDAGSLNKMLALDTPIPMADGSWKLNGDIVDGDLIIGSDGNPTEVLQAHPVQMPERAFELEFASGDKIKAGGEHLWTIIDARKNTKIMDTKDIFDYLNKFKQPLFIPRVGRVNFDKKELPIEPYLLGCWLGDGHSHSSRITTEDKEIINAFVDAGFDIKEAKHQNSGKAKTYHINGGFWNKLRSLNLIKRNNNESIEKHIPLIYLQSSYEDRLELLRGLMDTDGCYHSGSTAIFTQKDNKLFWDVKLLVESLGGFAQYRQVFPGELAIDGQKYYQMTVTILDNPFKISKKANKWKPAKKMYDKQKIVSIKEIEVEPMRCLSVKADDRMYCCGNKFTVTRNTATGISAIMSASNQRLELIARMFLETGVTELFRFLIYLNQKFVDQNQVIRLTNQELVVTPDDLRGEFDIVVNAGVGMTTKEANMMHLQTILTGLIQALQTGIPIVTPENIYNVYKKWINEAGYKNASEFVTDPQIVMNQQLQQMIASLPPEMQELVLTGQISPEQAMMMIQQMMAQQGGQQPVQRVQQGNNNPRGTGTSIGGLGGGASGQNMQSLPGSMAGNQDLRDNRFPQGMPIG